MTGQDRRDRQLADLGVDRAEDRRGAHDDVVGGERDEGSTAHGVVGHVHRDLGRVGGQRGSDLLGGEDEPAGGVQDQLDGHRLVGHLDGPDDRLGVVDVDVAAKGDAEEGEALAAVDQGDDP